MRTKELGNTGVEIPEIGLGTSQYNGGLDPLVRGIEAGATLSRHRRALRHRGGGRRSSPRSPRFRVSRDEGLGSQRQVRPGY